MKNSGTFTLHKLPDEYRKKVEQIILNILPQDVFHGVWSEQPTTTGFGISFNLSDTGGSPINLIIELNMVSRLTRKTHFDDFKSGKPQLQVFIKSPCLSYDSHRYLFTEYKKKGIDWAMVEKFIQAYSLTVYNNTKQIYADRIKVANKEAELREIKRHVSGFMSGSHIRMEYKFSKDTISMEIDLNIKTQEEAIQIAAALEGVLYPDNMAKIAKKRLIG